MKTSRSERAVVMLEYLTVYPETKAIVKRYRPEDRCELYEAMMDYAFTGVQPEWPDEDFKWFVWEALKQAVDRAEQARQRKAEAGKASARQREEAQANRGQQRPTDFNRLQQTPTEVNPESESESESDKESETEKRDNAQARKRSTDAMFERFWKAYPRHTSKEPARKAFAKLNPDESLLTVILEAIERQKKSAQWSDPQYIPHPSTWLNQRRWEDEVVQGKQRDRPVVAQTDYSQREYEETPVGEIPQWLADEIEQEEREKAEYLKVHGIADTRENRERLVRTKGVWSFG